MNKAAFLSGWIVALGASSGAWADQGQRQVPGARPDGYTLLHNQWPIHPVGEQVALGDFPIAMAVDPEGRLAAVLHAGHGQHEVRIVDLKSRTVVDSANINETYCGVAFSSDGKTLACSGSSDGVIHFFSVSGGRLSPEADVRVVDSAASSVVAGFALSKDMGSAIVALAYDSRVARVNLRTGAVSWIASVGGSAHAPLAQSKDGGAPNEVNPAGGIISDANPLNIIWDERSHRAYASLWGESSVAVLDADHGRVIAHWTTGLHPNEMVLSRDRRLFVSNGGLNTVTVLDTVDGSVTEVLSSAASPGDLPGSTPDSLALSSDGSTLYVANAYTNCVAVFNVGARGASRPLGFIPTGWFPSSVRLTPDGRTLLVVSARGLKAMSNVVGGHKWAKIDELYRGSLGIVPLAQGASYDTRLSEWTAIAQRCRPSAPLASEPGDPIPERLGGQSPIRYVVYIIKENRTYDQVFGDLREGNGDSALCLFPERVTPNLHAIARQFVLLDNFYANAEVSASGHEWSTAGYVSEFVEKSWPINYGHHDQGTHVPYPAEGHYSAALPELGYLWDRAARAGVSYRSYGEFIENPLKEGDPGWTNMAALRGHFDPYYRSWDIHYSDRARADRFIAELRRFEHLGDMPRLQIVRLPQDHTAGGKGGAWTPEAMVADNDLAVGKVVEALSLSPFWKKTAVFVVEDDAQSGPDHVDAHRTEALVAGGFVRHGAVDSNPYTTCSMLRTIELILGLEPMSQFDEAAAPMRASFQATADLSPYHCVPANVNLESRNPLKGQQAAASAHMDFSREDLIDDQALNRVIWAAVRGENSRMPAPVHAAFVRQLPGADTDDD